MMKKTKLGYMDTDSLIIYIETNGIYKGIAEDVKARFYTETVNQIDHCLKEKQKSNWINER